MWTGQKRESLTPDITGSSQAETRADRSLRGGSVDSERPVTRYSLRQLSMFVFDSISSPNNIFYLLNSESLYKI